MLPGAVQQQSISGYQGAAAPVFCITLDMVAIREDRNTASRMGLLPAFAITGFIPRETRPTLLSPALMIITPMMAITALLLRPVNVSSRAACRP